MSEGFKKSRGGGGGMSRNARKERNQTEFTGEDVG